MVYNKSEDSSELGREFPSWTPELGSRLRSVIKTLGGGAEAGKIANISEDMLSRYVNGHSKPSFYTLAGLAKAAGVSLDWIAGFDIKMEPERFLGATHQQDKTQQSSDFDANLLIHISKAISSVYLSTGSRIAGNDLVEKSTALYAEIVAHVDDPTERLGAVKIKVAELKQELQKPVAEQDRSKLRA